jgi:hypothetical protein
MGSSLSLADQQIEAKARKVPHCHDIVPFVDWVNATNYKRRNIDKMRVESFRSLQSCSVLMALNMEPYYD